MLVNVRESKHFASPVPIGGGLSLLSHAAATGMHWKICAATMVNDEVSMAVSAEMIWTYFKDISTCLSNNSE